MTTVKRLEAGDAKCLDDGSKNQGVLISGGKGTIIALMFDNKCTTHAQVHELDRLLGNMGLQEVVVQTEP